MGDQVNTSLTTGARNKRGKQRPKMNQQQRRAAKEQRLEDKTTRRAAQGKDSPHAERQFHRMKKQDQRRAARHPPGPTAATPPSSPTAAPGAPTSPGPPSGTGGAAPDLATQLQPYTAPMPPIIKAYMDKLSAGQVNAPTFQEQFGNYKAIAEREAGRQSAAINESMGSMGSRYGSAVLGAQQNLRESTTQDLAKAASDYQSQIEQNQFKEISAAGGLAYGATEAGMDRYWQDFLRRTSPPPFVGMAGDVSGGYGLPPTVVGA